jgi:hypothetical protein
MKTIKTIFLLLSIFLSTPILAQDKGTGPPEKSIASERRLRKLDKKESKERRRKEKAEKKAVKEHHKRLQTKQVRKRMKQSKNRANLNNQNKREFFLVRWFKKRKKV